MKKSTTMLDFFKRKGSTSNSSKVKVELPITNVAISILENVDIPILENMNYSILENVDVPISQTQFQRIDLDSLDYDPETCKQILEYHVNQRDEIRWVYIIKGLHQPPLKTFKKNGKHNRSFQASWFRNNSTWLEYSPTTDEIFVYPTLSFIIQMGLWDKIYSLLVDLEIGERLGAKIVIFKVI